MKQNNKTNLVFVAALCTFALLFISVVDADYAPTINASNFVNGTAEIGGGPPAVWTLTQDVPNGTIEVFGGSYIDGEGHTINNISFEPDFFSDTPDFLVEALNIKANYIYLYNPAPLECPPCDIGLRIENSTIRGVSVGGIPLLTIDDSVILGSRSNIIASGYLWIYHNPDGTTTNVPENTSIGLDNDTFMNTVPNPNTAIIDYYKSLGTNKSIVETSDLLKAADDWSRNIAPPGFSEPITTQQLLGVADEWAKGE